MPNKPAPFVILGLGNPGPAYEGNRHNAGFRVIERLSERGSAPLRRRLFSPCRTALLRGAVPLLIVQPLTFMNRSGDAIPYLRRRWRAAPDRLVVVVDNLDLPCGACRMKRGGGHAGHNGLKSLVAVLGGGDFLRLYVGIGHPGSRERVVDHVLGDPGPEEKALIDAAERRAADALLSLGDEPLDRVIEGLNRRGP